MSVSPITDDSIDLWSLDCTDLQSDVVVGDNAITGTLKYVADYSTAFPSGLDSGNYLALHCEVPDVEDVTITVKVTDPVTLEEDGDVVLRIADKSSQTVTVVASKEGYETTTKVYSLNGLTCLSE